MEFPNHSRQLLHRLQQQRCQGFLCDCTVVVGEARFRAHRAVLASCSVYFHLLYKERTDTLDVVRLNSGIVTAPAFGLLLEFMYQGKLESPGLPVEDVLAAASYLRMYDIVRECTGKLDNMEQLSVQNKINERIALGAKDRGSPDTELQHQTRTSQGDDESESNNKLVRPAVFEYKGSVQSMRKARGHTAGSLALVGPARQLAPRSHPSVSEEMRAVPAQWSRVMVDMDGALDLSCKPPPGIDPPGTFGAPALRTLGEEQPDTMSLIKGGRGLGVKVVVGGGALADAQKLNFGTSRRSPTQNPELLERGWERAEGPQDGAPRGGSEEEEEEDGCVSGGTVLLLGKGLSCLHQVCRCPICSRSFPSRRLLQLHLETHFQERNGTPSKMAAPACRGGRPACQQCGKTFSCLYTVRRHERTHSGEKPYTCAHCGKSFQYSHNLSRHAVVHTRQKPHPCSICARRFTQSGDLYRHIRKFHHGDPEEITVK